MTSTRRRRRIARNCYRGGGLGATAILLTAAQMSSAAGPHGIRTDGTLGPAATTVAGPNYNITQSLGSLSGKNLFYSFQYFNVASGETALFTTTTPGLANIISRVTGGFASDIAGTLQVSAASAAPDFFFINPSGVTFAAGAVVNVPAALYVSTANYLKFPDGRFYSDTTHTSQLSAAAPEAFGFLGTTRAPVNIQTSLSPGPGAQFQAVAGDVTVDGQGSGAGVLTIDGNIRVIATGTQTTEVPLSGPYSSSDGQVTVQNGGLLEALGDATTAAGEIDLSAGTITVDGAHSTSPTGVASVASAGGAGQISLDAGGDILIQNGGAVISAATDIAPGADVNIQAANLAIKGGDPNYTTGITLRNDGAGAGGTLNVMASALTLDATGNSASDKFTGMRSLASSSATGPSGQIVANIAGPISILNGAELASSAAGSNAAAGAIDLTGQTATIAGGATAVQPTGVGSSTGAADAGPVSVNISGDLRLTSGGSIFSGTLTPGAGANISVQAGTLTSSGWDPNFPTGILAESYATGASGAVNVNAGKVLLDGTGAVAPTPLTGIQSARRSSATGPASPVIVTSTGDVSVLNGADIKSVDQGSNVIQGGSVTVNAASLTVDSGTSTQVTGIGTNSVNGSAGNITVNVNGSAQILNSGLIFSGASAAAGRSGDLSVQVGSLLMEGGGNLGFAQIASESSGPGGNVTLDSQGAIQLANSEISSTSSGSANAGNVSVSGTALTMTSGAVIGAPNFSTGSTGNVSVDIAGPIKMSVDPTAPLPAAFISTQVGTGGTGAIGSITINAQSLSMDGKGGAVGISSANLGPSDSVGRLAVTTSGQITLANGAFISAGAASGGNSGDLSVNAASLTLNGGQLSTDSLPSATGSAGTLTVTATGPITLSNGGVISSSTGGGGNAGNVTVSTPGLVSISGPAIVTSSGPLPGEIASASLATSTGQSGNVSVSAGTLFVGGAINVADDATRPAQNLAFPSKVQVQAGSIVLDGGIIFASSLGNVDAGSIDITYTKSLTATNAAIDTSAASSNGGAITVTGSGILSLSRSQITTSVLGSKQSTTGGTSNGGDIQISAPFILLDTAAIQANTNVQLASGGNVNIQAQAIVPTYGSFILGGNEVAFDEAQPGLNLVQAVAPKGVSGTLNVTTPTLDIGNSLVALRGAPAAAPSLGRSPCGHGAGNTLSLGGRGGLLPTTRGPLWSALDPGAPAESDSHTPTSDNQPSASDPTSTADSAPADLLHAVPLLGPLSPCTNSSTTTTSRPSLPSL